ncbi:MAG: signal recognition particle protein [Sutterellaceae bacterium]|nr:signal recognition particle protein [Sutterellaceae bacterium]MDD7441135.1 signal recognition particle protein [Sutterellaceae bacterium]MDY2867466.1 signal recognition particle protein [Mesosutterella sp.]
MLDTLTQRLAKVVKTMRGQARITEENSKEMLREVRLALLEADVALPVVRDLTKRIKEKALGEEVVGSLNPGQVLVGIVQRELTSVIGGDLPEKEREINLACTPPAVILLAGLQGAGKTTTAGKLAKWLIRNQKKKVLAVSADVYRPAAIEQLKTVAAQAGAEFFPSTTDQKPLDIAAAALDYAKKHFFDVLIVDTAGRLSIDERMMQEVADLSSFLKPIETFFVVDAMVGQDAINTAKAFNERLPLTGVILTKVDGDSRGGAALSVRAVTGKPIKFIGTGEKLDGFDAFSPEQMASRILGMGDIVALVKDVTSNIDAEKAKKMADRMRKSGRLDLNDFREQMVQMRSMGSMSSLLEKLPAEFQEAAAKQNVSDADADRMIRRTIGIIDSMTPAERRHPDLIKASRKRRIAAGAGLPVQEVNKLLKQYDQMSEVMKRMRKGGLSKLMRMAGGRFPGFGGRFPGFGGMR